MLALTNFLFIIKDKHGGITHTNNIDYLTNNFSGYPYEITNMYNENNYIIFNVLYQPVYLNYEIEDINDKKEISSFRNSIFHLMKAFSRSQHIKIIKLFLKKYNKHKLETTYIQLYPKLNNDIINIKINKQIHISLYNKNELNFVYFPQNL